MKTKSISYFLCAAMLFLLPLAADSSPSEFGKLLMELEKQTLLASQYPTWSDKRDPWWASVRSAVTVRDLVEPLIDLEISIKSEAQGGTWSSRRTAWISEVRAAQDLNTLVNLLLEMETPIKWEALYDVWRTRRDGWRAEVLALKNAPAVLVPVSSGGASTEFGKLLLELDQQTRITAQVPEWLGLREGWVASTRSAVNVRDLSGSLALFGVSIKWEVMSEAWKDRIGRTVEGREFTPGWARDVTSAKNLNALVDLLLELEAATKWEATVDGWRTRRDGWLAEVRALKNTTSVAAPTPVIPLDPGKIEYWSKLASETDSPIEKIAYYTEAIRLWNPPSNDTSHWVLYHYRGWNAYFEADYAQASADHIRTAEMITTDPYLRFSASLTRMLEGKNAEALKEVDKALLINSKFAFALAQKGFVLGEMNRWDTALVWFAEAIAVKPDDAQGWLGTAFAHLALGRPAPARQAFREALKRQPDLENIDIWMDAKRRFTPHQRKLLNELVTRSSTTN